MSDMGTVTIGRLDSLCAVSEMNKAMRDLRRRLNDERTKSGNVAKELSAAKKLASEQREKLIRIATCFGAEWETLTAAIDRLSDLTGSEGIIGTPDASLVRKARESIGRMRSVLK